MKIEGGMVVQLGGVLAWTQGTSRSGGKGAQKRVTHSVVLGRRNKRDGVDVASTAGQARRDGRLHSLVLQSYGLRCRKTLGLPPSSGFAGLPSTCSRCSSQYQF